MPQNSRAPYRYLLNLLSYRRRLSASLSVSYASFTALKIASASVVCSGFLSGCHRFESEWYARLTSSALAQAATRDGALDKKTKELIALAIGVAARCDGCIGFHTEALVKLGATRQEVEETLGMAVYMGGGPSLMYAADAISAYEQFEKELTVAV